VAVKVLTKLETDGEEFINGVASISRTSHINTINLFGFLPWEDWKSLTKDEYMPDGSLDKFISYKGFAQIKSSML
jgi:hypothetical protein